MGWFGCFNRFPKRGTKNIVRAVGVLPAKAGDDSELRFGQQKTPGDAVRGFWVQNGTEYQYL